MDLHGGAPFWLLRNAFLDFRDPLPAETDVVIIGTGITGACVARALTREGFRVAVVDRRSISEGSTAASTALLMYELDVELGALQDRLGAPRADRAYRRIAAAIPALAATAAQLPHDVGWRAGGSLYLATRLGHGRRLRHETGLRQAADLEAEWLSRDQLRIRFGFDANGAIHTPTAATVDPVRLTRALLEQSRTDGATVTDRTAVTECISARDRIAVVTDRGTILARWCVAAMGYETPPGLTPPRMSLHSTFAFVTEPLALPPVLARGTVVWESRRPYLYVRSTTDGRILVGGADVPFRDPDHRDALLPARRARLERRARQWFPCCELPVAHSWCGTFAETPDGLPFIGPVLEAPRMLMAIGAGGNGIPFAQVAAEIITAHCLGEGDPDEELFRPDRFA